MAKRDKVLVFNADKDGYAAFFMMKNDDFRAATQEARDRWGYKLLDAQPVYSHREKLLTSTEGVFQVMGDWSLKPINDSAKACALRMLKEAQG